MNSTSYRQNEDFNFRYDAPPGLDYRAADQHRAPRSPPRGRAPDRNGYQANDNQRRPRGGHRGGRGGPRLAADRAFLKTNRDPTPELMPGMDEDAGAGVRFKPVDDLSDSDEAEMDLTNTDDEADGQESKKKQARTETKAADADSVPRWSNPDPYTALPPPDESQRKKKDVVKLIRKARVAADTENNAKTEATADDFISFDFDDGTDVVMGEQFGLGVEGAPTGPRANKDDASRQQGLQERPYEPRVDLKLPDKSSQQDIPFTANTNVNTGDIGSDLRAASGVSLDGNHVLGLAPNSKSSMQHALPARPPPVSLTSDPALGNRKRNIDDEIKGPPRIHGEDLGKKKPIADGSITPQWLPVPHESPTPWISIDHSDSAKMGIWLHKEIMDFYHYVKPRDFEQLIRVKLVENLRASVKKHFNHEADILAFGSFPAGLYLPTADMDIVCVSNRFMRGQEPDFHEKKILYRFRSFLQKYHLALDDKIELIIGAKVPLVKYVDRLTGLKVDISFENDTGLIANKTFQDWKVEFPAMPIIVSLVKHILAMRGLNEPVNGGIGGFSVICLVVSLLQNMPQVQSRTMIPEHHLGEILMEFFDLYGNQFNIETTGISMKPPGYVSKTRLNIPYREQTSNKFCIMDPNRSNNNISGGARNSPVIRGAFSDCFKRLQERMVQLQYSAEADRRCESILGTIIGGNYSSFRLQREHLAHVYEKYHGPIDLTG
ncbi:uncharacterized protein LY89DRAFT_579514 [Mollisia scopiformis]|uniref:polynucleotide adenylyltransferase n=1 Tax=Mollisia scopiformis TaxID=149040 RepID=A0A194XKU0_MOLSC|nr:uncharacterized protein LY89DRAFT_579514 [Mollisia scopiformis]KUJ20746.1 hypothetical protein LY89DRAFT_579514 [Mollisia scopiformis]